MSSCLQQEIHSMQATLLTTWLHNTGFDSALDRQKSSIRSAFYQPPSNDQNGAPNVGLSQPRRLTDAESITPKHASAMATTAVAYGTTALYPHSLLQAAGHKAASKRSTTAKALSQKLDTIAEEVSDVVLSEVDQTPVRALEAAKVPFADALLFQAQHSGLSCIENFLYVE